MGKYRCTTGLDSVAVLHTLNIFSFLVESKSVKLENSCAVILHPMISNLWLLLTNLDGEGVLLFGVNCMQNILHPSKMMLFTFSRQSIIFMKMASLMNWL